jgi:hypothetical protein
LPSRIGGVGPTACNLRQICTGTKYPAARTRNDECTQVAITAAGCAYLEQALHHGQVQGVGFLRSIESHPQHRAGPVKRDKFSGHKIFLHGVWIT